jgi:hypothetical protein
MESIISMHSQSSFFRSFFLRHRKALTSGLFGLLLCGYFGGVAGAQTYSPLMGIGSAQFFDNNGKILAAGVLYSYQAGTTTQQATYTDVTGTAMNPNPIPFGSGARVSIWLTSSLFYKFVLCVQNDGATCAPADVLFSVDQVPGSTVGAFNGTFTGTLISGSINPATAGIIRLASGDTVCWRNAAGSANLCFGTNPSDVLVWNGMLEAANFLSTCTPISLSGTIRFCSTDTINWRNNANSGDVSLSKNSSDNLVFPNGFSLGGGTALATTNQSGTGNLCLTTNCQLVTPALNGVTISGTPSSGCVLTASSPSAATWVCPSTTVTKDFSVSGCSTAASTDSQCNGTITIPGGGFADASYFPVLTVNATAFSAGGPGPFLSIEVAGALTSTTIPYNITCTFGCNISTAATIYVHAFHP